MTIYTKVVKNMREKIRFYESEAAVYNQLSARLETYGMGKSSYVDESKRRALTAQLTETHLRTILNKFVRRNKLVFDGQFFYRKRGE